MRKRRSEKRAHSLLVFPAQKMKKSLSIAPTAPYTELLPATLRDYDALKSIRSNLQAEVSMERR